MENLCASLPKILLCTGILASTACTEAKQSSQQEAANPTMTDARPDLANQANPVDHAKSASTKPNQNANPADDQRAVTTNPNSARNTTDSTLNTSAGAAVVGNANMNPANCGEGSNVPTSIDNAAGDEPMVDAHINSIVCRDAIANNYLGRTAGKTNTCPATARSRIKDKDTAGQVTR